jgi:hypothetical protein
MKIKHTDDPIQRRVQEYPAIGDQLDQLYKGFKGMAAMGWQFPPEIRAWLENIDRVKAKFPKEKAK